MKKRIIGILLALILVFATVGLTIAEKDNIIYVDDDNTSGPWDGTIDHPFQFIQDGIDASSDGDMVFAFSGRYVEHVIVNTSITLIGENKDQTVLDGDNGIDVVKIISDEVTISNFTIRNSNAKYAGIRCCSDDCFIINNILEGHGSGVKIDVDANWSDIDGLSHVINTTIINNHFVNNSEGVTTKPHTYFGWTSKNTKIFGNTFSQNSLGIRLIWADNCRIYYNNFWNNDQDAFFQNPLWGAVEESDWKSNYWDRPRLLPHPIIGLRTFLIIGLFLFIAPSFQFDWHPAAEPYDIDGGAMR
jgi:parallel beta-helix repeat protein